MWCQFGEKEDFLCVGVLQAKDFAHGKAVFSRCLQVLVAAEWGRNPQAVHGSCEVLSLMHRLLKYLKKKVKAEQALTPAESLFIPELARALPVIVQNFLREGSMPENTVCEQEEGSDPSAFQARCPYSARFVIFFFFSVVQDACRVILTPFLKMANAVLKAARVMQEDYLDRSAGIVVAESRQVPFSLCRPNTANRVF